LASTNTNDFNRGLILATIEMSWLTFPSTFNSSCALLACHFLLVTGLFRSESKPYRMPEWLAKDHAE
jgi:alpha-1,3-mannosyltransferase